MSYERINELVNECTLVYRKGEIVTERGAALGTIFDIYAMPAVGEANSGQIMVDVHFMVVGIDPGRSVDVKDELLMLLRQDFPNIDQGPSYISAGADLGSQEMALRLYALGQTFGWWTVITPEAIGVTGEEAEQMAGLGFVYIMGFNPNGVTP